MAGLYKLLLVGSLFLLWLLLAIVLLAELGKLVHACRGPARVRELSRPQTPHRASTSLIVPFRGLDLHLAENIRSFLAQEAGETIFVVDSREDPAYPLLRKLGGKRVRIILSSRLTTCSGKCAALVAGVRAASGGVLVFADSDALLPDGWLRALADPLQDPQVGATTGYRWYTPARGCWASLKSVWNESPLSLMLSPRAFVWGGSFAVRRADLAAWEIPELWSRTISDDATLTREVRARGKLVRFCPAACVSSDAETTPGELWEFSNRQVFMVRHFMQRSWEAGLVVHGLTLLGLVAGMVALFTPGLRLPGALLVLAPLLAIPRSVIRRRAFQVFFPAVGLRPALLAPCTGLLLFVNSVHATFQRSITWRGRAYAVAPQSGENVGKGISTAAGTARV